MSQAGKNGSLARERRKGCSKEKERTRLEKEAAWVESVRENCWRVCKGVYKY